MTPTFEPICHGGSAPDGNPVGLTLSGVFDDVGFAEVLALARIEDSYDAGGFELFTGFNEFGHVAYYIKNGMRDGAHVVISTPMGAAEWLKRAGV